MANVCSRVAVRVVGGKVFGSRRHEVIVVGGYEGEVREIGSCKRLIGCQSGCQLHGIVAGR